jgi:hypothetical protein
LLIDVLLRQPWAYAPALTTAGQTMLTTHKKTLILANAGVDVPACPSNGLLNPQPSASCATPIFSAEQEAQKEMAFALTQWSKAIEVLYVEYAAARAARSLREAEEVRQLDMLRRANARKLANR